MKPLCLFIAVTLLAVVSSATVDNCQWGPSFWCQSIENAKTCQKVDYCKDKVWKEKVTSAILVHGSPIGGKKVKDVYKAAVASPKSAECDVCKIIVGYADRLLQQNTTEQEAKAEVEKLCDILPSSLGGICKSLVDQDFDELWQLLVKGLSPDTVCTTLGLCTSSKGKASAAAATSPKNEIECKICEIAVGFADRELKKNSTEDQAKAAVEGLCALLKDIQPECKTFVDAYFDQIWQLLIDEANPDEVCKTIGVCSSTTLPAVQLTATPSSISSSIKCEACELVAKQIITVLKEQKTKDDAKAALMKMCDVLKPVTTECDSFVNHYFEQIWDEIMKGTASPQTFCQEFFSDCTATKRSRRGIKGLECYMCKKVAGVLLNKFADPDSLTKTISAMVDPYCDHMPSEDQTTCKSFVNAMVKVVVRDALNSSALSPEGVCQMADYCKSSQETSTSMKTKRSTRLSKTTDCSICIDIANVIESSTTEEIAKEGVATACAALGPAAIPCKLIVDAYFDKLWDYIKNELGNASEACAKLKLCPAITQLTVKLSALPTVKQTPCDLCKLAVAFLKPYVNSNATEEEVKQALEQLCSLLPDNSKSECKQLVDQDFDLIWALVKSEVKNDEICRQLGLCNTTATLYQKEDAILKKITKQKRVKPASVKQTPCDLCKLAVAFLKPYVNSNATEEEVEQALKQLCSLLPDNTKSECTVLINTYFKDIWDLLKKEVDSGDVCLEIHLCNSTAAVYNVKPKKAFTDKCTVCEKVLTVVKDILPFTSKLDVDGMKEACKLLPSDITSECVDIVTEYGPELIKLMDGAINPQELCKSVLMLKTSLVQQSLSAHVKQTPNCEVCQIIVKFITVVVHDNMTEDDVKKLVEDLCTLLPTNISGQCKILSDEWIDLIWWFIKQVVDNNDVCKLIGVCNNTATDYWKRTTKIKKTDPNDTLCDECKLIIMYIDTFVKNNKSEDEVKKYLYDFCSLLEGGKDQCESIVNQYLPQLWELLTQDLKNATEVCEWYGLCPRLAKLKKTFTDKCTVCEKVLTVVKDILPLTSKLDVDGMKEACKLLPSDITSECIDIVTEYGPELIKLMDGAINPQELCKDIKLCS